MMPPPTLVAATAGLLVALSVGAMAFSLRPPTTRARRAPLGTIGTPRRFLAGAVMAVVVLVATRWVAAAAGAGALVVGWRWLLASTTATVELTKVEAIAKWLEDLRDLLRRSSLGVEDAIEMAATTTTSGPLAVPLATLVIRRRQGMRMTDALWDLAQTVAHPTCDSAVAAIQLVLDGGAGGARLYDTLEELAASARDEVRARQEILRIRRVYQQAMRRLLVITIVFVAVLAWFARDLLAPYRQPAGQVWLLIPVGLWAGSMTWLRHLMRFDAGARYRLRRPDEVRA